MIKYSDMSTSQLIDQLYIEGAKVEIGLIRQVVERGEEAASYLRRALVDEENWYEGTDGNYWIVLHALTVLGMMKDETALPQVFEMLPHAYFSDHEAAIESLSAVIAAFGPAALTYCRKFIEDYRGAYRDNPDYSYCRCKALTALTMIASADQSLRKTESVYVCGLYENAAEDDATFLSFSTSCPVALDSKRGLDALRKAYERGAIDRTICGTFAEMRDAYLESPREFVRDLNGDRNSIDALYDPMQIEKRLKYTEVEPAEKLYWNLPEVEVPAGFQFTETGNLVNPVKVGRNDPCPCGSGTKYKKCCGVGG